VRHQVSHTHTKEQLNYFQNLCSQVGNHLSLYQNNEAITLNELTTVLTKFQRKTQFRAAQVCKSRDHNHVPLILE